MSSATILKEVNLGHTLLRWRSNEIMEIICDDDVIYEVKQLSEIVVNIGLITNQKKCLQLIVAGKYSNVSKEAREFMALEESVRFSIAEAYILQSLAQKIVANFFLRFNTPKAPTRMFTNRESAEKWLRTFK